MREPCPLVKMFSSVHLFSWFSVLGPCFKLAVLSLQFDLLCIASEDAKNRKLIGAPVTAAIATGPQTIGRRSSTGVSRPLIESLLISSSLSIVNLRQFGWTRPVARMSSKVPWVKSGAGDDHGIDVEAVPVDRGGNGGLRVSKIHLGLLTTLRCFWPNLGPPEVVLRRLLARSRAITARASSSGDRCRRRRIPSASRITQASANAGIRSSCRQPRRRRLERRGRNRAGVLRCSSGGPIPPWLRRA